MLVLSGSRLSAGLREAAVQGHGRQTLLQQAANGITAAGEPFTGVYMYMLHGNELVLEAYSGRETEHKVIKVGHGVCRTAVATGENQNVPDVTARDNYIACNRFTKSELVVLIRKHGEIVGQIDIDSDSKDPFHEEEVVAIQEIAQTLGELL